MAELAQRAGIPPGVFNVVTGDAVAIGSEFTGNPIVRKLSFTGSTAVGKLLMSQCAGTVKKVALELGGNAPFLVLEDADLDAAVAGAIASKYRNTGQTCVCANRFIVHSKVYDAFAAKLAEAVMRLRVGDGLKGETDQGPLIDAKALAKVESHVADAKAKGAKVITGGARHALGGTFYQPTVLTDVSPAMQLAREETFGPVAPLFRVESDDEAVQLANDTEFGLVAYVYTKDLARGLRVSEAIEAGMVGLNSNNVRDLRTPFVGVKASGLGHEGGYRSIDFYTDQQAVHITLGEPRNPTFGKAKNPSGKGA
jgi:succinate-semialdehyde dehydrogenase/glutarate-semialdehyde dehydrogenase